MRTINNDEELNRQLAIMRAAHEYQSDLAEQKNQAALPTKKLGRPGYVQTTPQTTPGGELHAPGRELQALGKATLAGKQLGSPESYGGQQALKPEEIGEAQKRMATGQQEFYQPIPVTRGMTTTYQGPRYGTEYASPGQAAQAFRMEQGAKYEAPESGKSAFYGAALKKEDRALGEQKFEYRLKGLGEPYVLRDAKGNLVINPKLEHLAFQVKEKAWENPEEAVKEFKSLADEYMGTTNKIGAISSKEGRERMLKNYREMVSRGMEKPGMDEIFMKAPITKDNLHLFERVYNPRLTFQQRQGQVSQTEPQPFKIEPHPFWKELHSGLQGEQDVSKQLMP